MIETTASQTSPHEEQTDQRELVIRRLKVLADEIRASRGNKKGPYSIEALEKYAAAQRLAKANGISQASLLEIMEMSHALRVALSRTEKKGKHMGKDSEVSTSFFKLLPKAQEEVTPAPEVTVKGENRIRFIEVVTSDERTLEAAIARFLKE